MAVPCCLRPQRRVYSFFFNDTATTEIYTLSLHDALPIWRSPRNRTWALGACRGNWCLVEVRRKSRRSEEHTSELQSRQYLVCRLLLEQKKTTLAYSCHPPRLDHRRVYYSAVHAPLVLEAT